ncbi:MAG TPA: DUF190 domain-containing protein, partial [Bryobacteraceae bacterium]|nr:DUF190 domain-containing protein [Bryobacteraceae bacterium]
RGSAKMMQIYLGEADRWHDEPLHEAILKQFQMMDIAGATVYRGILGYGAKHNPHTGHLFHLAHNFPIMISVVDKQEKIEEAIATIRPMMGEVFIVLSDVETVRLAPDLPT